MKNVLVTGHSGFVGKALHQHLSSLPEFRVQGVSRSEQGIDLEDPASIQKLPPAEIVFHLAGAVGVALGWQRPELVYRINYLTTLNVLEYCRRQSAQLIYLSSYMYGRPLQLPIDENHRIECLNPYARSKRAGEELCEAYSADFGLNVSLVRPFNIYGFGEPETTIIASLLKQLENGNRVEVHSLDTKRDFLYLGDLVELLVRIARSPRTGCRAYNVGSGTSHSTTDIVKLLEVLLERDIEVSVRGEARRNEIPDCFSDNSRIREEFGYEPTTSLLEGLRLLSQHLVRST